MGTSVKQAACRMNGHHIRILREIEDGTSLTEWRQANMQQAPIRQLRGHMTAVSTLHHWGAIADDRITEFGKQALAEYRSRT